MTKSIAEEPSAAHAADAGDAAAQASEASTSEVPAPGKPGRGKKRRTSRGLRDIQKAERHLTKAALRMATAVAEGVATYSSERQRSAEAKRDGAFWDFPQNAAKGLEAAWQESSHVPVDLARALDSRTARRAFRLGAKALLWPLRR